MFQVGNGTNISVYPILTANCVPEIAEDAVRKGYKRQKLPSHN